MEAKSPYNDIVLRHQRDPHNFGTLPDHTHAAEGINALCGDRMHLEVDYRDENLVALRFSGESCALTIASASIMSDMVVGRDRRAIDRLASRFALFIEGDDADRQSLGELHAFEELRRHAARRKCALLPWATLRAALTGAVVATTENPSLGGSR
jgi:nitrogen fixation NifU-like protein